MRFSATLLAVIALSISACGTTAPDQTNTTTQTKRVCPETSAFHHAANRAFLKQLGEYVEGSKPDIARMAQAMETSGETIDKAFAVREKLGQLDPKLVPELDALVVTYSETAEIILRYTQLVIRLDEIHRYAAVQLRDWNSDFNCQEGHERLFAESHTAMHRAHAARKQSREAFASLSRALVNFSNNLCREERNRKADSDCTIITL